MSSLKFALPSSGPESARAEYTMTIVANDPLYPRYNILSSISHRSRYRAPSQLFGNIATDQSGGRLPARSTAWCAKRQYVRLRQVMPPHTDVTARALTSKRTRTPVPPGASGARNGALCIAPRCVRLLRIITNRRKGAYEVRP